MTSKPGKQVTAIHILSNISKSKGNKTMKFRHLIKHKIRNIILEKSETVSRSFSKKIKIEHNSGSIVLCFIHFVFIVCQVEGYQNILKLCSRPLVFASYKAFLKTKRDLELVSYYIFCMNSEIKYFFYYILLTEQISFSGCLYFVRFWEIYAL